MTEETTFITEEEKAKETKKDNSSQKSFEWKNIVILGRFLQKSSSQVDHF